MKSKNKVFFAKEGERGITASEAGHICNIAKDMSETLQSEINSCSYVDAKIGLLGTESEKTISISNPISFATISNSLERIGNLNGLIAYLKEAIKAKEDETDYLEERLIAFDYENACILFNEENLRKDIAIEVVQCDGSFGISQLSISERARYYHLEAICAKIGKYIHKDGAFYESVNNAKKAIVSPIEKEIAGSGVMIITKTVDKSFEGTIKDLQDLHRKYSAELNGIKAKIDDFQNQNKMEYLSSMENYRNAIKKRDQEVENHSKLLQARFETYINEQLEAIKKFKIVIPHMFQELVDEIKK